MKRFTALLLAALLIFSMCGCEDTEALNALSGTWTKTAKFRDKETSAILYQLKFWDSEVALADLGGMDYVETAVFNNDKTYTLGYDAAGTEEKIREYLESFFEILYDNRTTIDEYGGDADEDSLEEFETFYATELMTYTGFDAMLDAMCEAAVEAFTFTEESGTFELTEGTISCTAAGDTESTDIQYVIDGTNLTLTFGNGSYVYSR